MNMEDFKTKAGFTDWGDYKKDEIRDLALKLNLHVFDKSDSQDICFIPDGDYKKFINIDQYL